jgi:hypothetical protein
MRLTIMALLLLAGCSKEPAPVRADFDHWMEPDGTIHWMLTVTPAAWQKLGKGERLDARHQKISESALSAVSELIDANLRYLHLCPGQWTMGDVRHFDNDYLTFAGSCDTPVGSRT